MKPISELLNFSIINIDKPVGPTSFQVSQFVKNQLGINKTSHFGTLDPKVSGVLPIALKRACRLSDFFMHHDKEYIGIMRIHTNVSEQNLKKEMQSFIGKITQLPPVRSRVKRVERIREVKRFQFLEKEERDVLFKATVQAGTYIRKLCDDLGKQIGGAHMLELRRTRAGIFSEETSITLYDFGRALNDYKNGNESQLRKILIPAEEAIKEVLPSAQIKEKSLRQLLTGKPITRSDIINPLPSGDHLALFHNSQLIAIVYKVAEGDIIARPSFVFN